MANLNDAASRPAVEAATAAGQGARPARFGPRSALLVLWLALLPVPFLTANDYIIYLFVTFFINLILVASLNTLIGYGGQISLGHAGFFGLGAYAAGIVSAKTGVSAWLGLPLACGVGGCAALLIGVPALRLKGHYLAMATLGFNAILTVLFTQLIVLTGGPNGLLGVEPLMLGHFALDTPARIFPVVWLCAGFCVLALVNLIESRVGRALRAVAMSEVAANSLGIDVFRTKLIVFVLTAAMAGLAGALYVESNLYAAPETFGFSASILLLAMVALGGWGRFAGAFLGALILTAAPEVLRSFEDAELLMFGIGMIVVLLFFPGGLAGAGASLRGIWRRRMP